ncbi:MAG: hypothetical protein JSV90_04555 [Methanobacteriota archaeon]|nr:MAG: hypothetical protein JSV90_04555 [Euryarchaeota archaeon]
MGLNMALTEIESPKSLCRDRKLTMAKVYVNDPSKWADLVEVDTIVDLAAARKKLGEDRVEEILKRSRVKVEGNELYMEKVKEEADRKALSPFAKAVKTNWIVMSNVPKARKEAVLEASVLENSVTEWDLLEFDEMYETCAKCGLSWDNKKGCVGNFGPSTSPVPDLAKKFKLNILSNVENLASKKKVLTSEDAEALLKEVKVLREKTPAEGKMMVRRIDGTLNRLEAMAGCAKENGVGFYFF